MFGIGQTELIIIVVFAFLLFGPDKLPQMGRTIGRALRQFRETQEKVTSVVQSEVIDPMAAAANAPATSKKAAAADEDADADAPAASDSADLATAKATEARKETFAERRARLAAEKAAREAEAADAEGSAATAASGASAEGAVSGSSAEPAGDASGDRAEAGERSAADGQSADAAAEEDPQDTVASLYARRPRKHRAAEAEDAPGDEAPTASDDAPAADDAHAPVVASAASTETEKGGEQ